MGRPPFIHCSYQSERRSSITQRAQPRATLFSVAPLQGIIPLTIGMRKTRTKPNIPVVMTLNKGDKLRNMDKRRGSTPFPVHLQNLHRRSMPVDDRELRSTAHTGELSNLTRDTEGQIYKVVLLGDHGVGKSSLARIFGGVEDCHDCDEPGNTYDRSIAVDDEEASILLYDIWEQENSQWLREQSMRLGDAYIIVYSVTDKASFEKASELRIQLRRARQSENIPIILVGNKSDLVRSREVTMDEGSTCAVVFDCKFIETSASLHHNVRELFEGIVRQVRLRKDSKEENARRLANSKRRESVGKKAKRFLGRMAARKNKKMAFRQKSKSCHDLSVL
ncbi:hypothetical protein SKAU_G00345430 [Synaphobranchus kaupii]|uniref:GTP-binding protein n=1 Tax=Synaphobranchus kaupii TaxID=118154 RepID=A0A9Q1EJJ5_SYNKA|nr:hypothetical protein SKAU_G00345430 [Synaphobranchus kaupii]